jgi:hypothetical protein
MQNYTISFGKTVRSNVVVNKELTLDKLLEYFKEPKELNNVSLDQYRLLDKADKNEVKITKLGYWSGANYKESNGKPSRRKELVRARNLLTLDIDYADHGDLETIIHKLNNDLNVAYIIHTSISHDPNYSLYKYRLIIPCGCDIHGVVYENVASDICNTLGIHLFDTATSFDGARAMFEPCKLQGQEYRVYSNLSNPIYLPDIESIDTESNKSKILKRTLPSSLTGMEGVYNSLYTCPEVLMQYATDTYSPSDQSDPLNVNKRWTYRLGSSQDGIRFEDNGQLLHSEHNTDPLFTNTVNLGRKQWSAFELYAYFKHKGSVAAAERALSKDPVMIGKIAEEFEEVESFIQEKNEIRDSISPITWDELIKIRSIKEPREFIEFILDHGFAIAKGKGVELVFPIKKKSFKPVYSVGNNKVTKPEDVSIEFYNLSYGVPLECFCGYSGELINPKNPNKKIEALHYLFRYSEALKVYTGFTFVPYNLYSKYQDSPNIDNDKINMFYGYGLEPNWNYKDEINSYSLNIILDYILNFICSGDEQANTWLLDWLADIVQNPAEKPGTAVVLYSSERGVGKSTLFVLLKAILGALSQNLPHDMLGRRFNANLAYCLLGFLDDVSFQVKKDSAKMRTLVTSETRYVEKKGKDGYEIADCTRYLITSNHKHVVDVDASVEERRYTMLHLKDQFKLKEERTQEDKKYNTTQRKKKKEYFDQLYSCINNSADLFLAFLLDREITSNLRVMYGTNLYDDVSVGGLSKIDACLTELGNMTRKELIDTFEGEEDFSSSGAVVSITDDKVHIRKNNFKNYFSDNYEPRTTGFMLNNYLRESNIVATHNIDFTGKHKKRCVHHTFTDGKRVDCISIPTEFFENL